MEQYFTEQDKTKLLFYMEVTTLAGSEDERLEIKRVKREELEELAKTHTFVRQSGTAIPILKKV